ncbi:YceD family protein [Streptococcus hongkongensis]|nr:hypothetical protein NC01_03425 [Streptococcus uberis]
MLAVSEIKKKQEPKQFEVTLTIDSVLKNRNPEIIDIHDVYAKGTVLYDQGLFILDYSLDYTIVLPSSRSMTEVTLTEKQHIQELFIEESHVSEKKEMVEENLVLILTDPFINLEESVVDNILLSIPLQVLTEEEKLSEKFPAGDDWEVLTEEQYLQLKEENNKEANPFASLQGMFDE